MLSLDAIQCPVLQAGTRGLHGTLGKHMEISPQHSVPCLPSLHCMYPTTYTGIVSTTGMICLLAICNWHTEKSRSARACQISIQYICFAQTVDLGQSVDSPVQTMNPRFVQTIHGLSQAQHDQLNTYSKPNGLQCRIPNPKYKSLTLPCLADYSPSLRLCLSPLVCGAWLFVEQSVVPQIAQTIHGLLHKAWIHGLCKAIHELMVCP